MLELLSQIERKLQQHDHEALYDAVLEGHASRLLTRLTVGPPEGPSAPGEIARAVTGLGRSDLAIDQEGTLDAAAILVTTGMQDYALGRSDLTFRGAGIAEHTLHGRPSERDPYTDGRNDRPDKRLHLLATRHAERSHTTPAIGRLPPADCSSDDRAPNTAGLPPMPPCVDLRRSHVDNEGDKVLDITHLHIESDEGILRCPPIVDFEPGPAVHLGPYVAAAVTYPSWVGPIGYANLLYVFSTEDPAKPCLIIAAETSPNLLEAETPPVGPYLCVLRPGGRMNLGPREDVADPSSFVELSGALAATLLRIPQEQVAVVEVPILDYESQYHKAQEAMLREDFEAARRELATLLDVTTNSFLRTLRARSLLAIARCDSRLGNPETARTNLQLLHDIEAARGHHDNLAVAELEMACVSYLAGELDQAEDHIRNALNLKLMAGVRPRLSGLAFFSEPYNSDIGTDLFLLGHLHLCRGDRLGAFEYLEHSRERAASEQDFRSLAAVLTEISLVYYEQAQVSKALQIATEACTILSDLRREDSRDSTLAVLAAASRLAGSE